MPQIVVPDCAIEVAEHPAFGDAFDHQRRRRPAPRRKLVPSADVTSAWGHLNVNVSDLARSIAFYERLGFSLMLDEIPHLGLSLYDESVLTDTLCQAYGLSLGTALAAASCNSMTASRSWIAVLGWPSLAE